MTYDPCRPIHYVVNLSGAPPGSRRLIHRAIGLLQAATGLDLVDDGTTTERPAEDRQAVQTGRYGDHWAPVLIAWAAEEDYPPLRGKVVGVGGSARTGSGADGRYVTGQAVLDLAAFTSMLTVDHDQPKALAIVLHELGHVVGLAHVPDPSQVMYPEAVAGVDGYADGDLRGLAILGAGRCYP